MSGGADSSTGGGRSSPENTMTLEDTYTSDIPMRNLRSASVTVTIRATEASSSSSTSPIDAHVQPSAIKDATKETDSDKSTSLEEAVLEEVPLDDNVSGTLTSQPQTDSISQANTNTNATERPPFTWGQPARREITADECGQQLPALWSTRKKWAILIVLALVQVSMNLNTTLYSNAIPGIMAQFNVSDTVATSGAGIFLVTYAFGCELWAPWSEELGRKSVLQASLFLVSIFCIPVALATDATTILVCRALGGLASAGGSVTLGVVADMYTTDTHQPAVAFVSLSSVLGAVFGAVVGGFVEQYLAWQWCIWLQIIFGAFVQILHWLLVPETRKPVVMDKIAQGLRRTEPSYFAHVFGPNEIRSRRERYFNAGHIWATWKRPFAMLITEPIVRYLSLLSGFADAIIFMCVQSFGIVYAQWGFNAWQIGIMFLPIGLSYIIGWGIAVRAIRINVNDRQKAINDKDADKDWRAHTTYEGRLRWLRWTSPLLPVGLILFAGFSGGPPGHWAPTMVGTIFLGVANYAIYASTIDYMIAVYGEYAASATGGNGFARDLLAGALTWAAKPMYTGIQTGIKQWNTVQAPTAILAFISIFLVVAVFWVYKRGPKLRANSPFAKTLEHETFHSRPVLHLRHT